MNRENLKWYDRKRIWCGLPWTFTKYGMNEDRIFVEQGAFSIKEQEVRLYRILNINLSRSLVQRIFGLGTIHLDSTDHDLKCFELKNIKKSAEVKELISASVEEERLRNRVSSREYMAGSFEEQGDDEEELTQ